MPTNSAAVDAKALALLLDHRVAIFPQHIEVRGAHGTYEVTHRGDNWRCLCASRLKACSHIVAAQMALDQHKEKQMAVVANDPFAPVEYIEQERILAFGAAGSGKSTAWLEIAKWLQAAGSMATFWVLDTDRAAGRMMAGEKFAGLHQVKIAPCTNWTELMAATDAALDRARPGDWLVVDMVDKVWEYAQAHFTLTMHGKDMESYLMSVRKALGANSKNLKPFEGMVDWPVINGIYKAWSDRTLMNDRGIHVFGVSPMKAIDERLTGDEIKEAFGNLGVYPAGQKHLAHAFHTVLLMAQGKGNFWATHTAKDRERTFLKGKIGNFAADYMQVVAHFDPLAKPIVPAVGQPAPETTAPAPSGPTPPPATAAPLVDFTETPGTKAGTRLDEPPPPEEPLFNPDGSPANQAAVEFEPASDGVVGVGDDDDQLALAQGLIDRAEVPAEYTHAISEWACLRTWLFQKPKVMPGQQDAFRKSVVGDVSWDKLTTAQMLVICWAAEMQQAEAATS
ncbi:MAG: DEAD/DEAH box helicase family protein [Armatimonadota bacterium]